MKTFLVYNTSFFGDMILTNPLCRQLKRVYPHSHLVFISDKTYADVARYMDGVDEVWIYDKHKKHKGIIGFYNFYKEHKNAYSFDAAFIIYGNERGIFLSKLLGAKKIYADSTHKYVHRLLDNPPINYGKWYQIQDQNTYLAELYTQVPTESLPMKYHVPEEAFAYVDSILLKDIHKPIVALNPITKNKEKDLKRDMLIPLIELITKASMMPVIIGTGKELESYYESLPEHTKEKTLNLINITTVLQLAAFLKRTKVLISADTGTAHFALALDVPVVDIFYRKNKESLRIWAPKNFYRHKVLSAGDDFSAENIWKNALELINR